MILNIFNVTLLLNQWMDIFIQKIQFQTDRSQFETVYFLYTSIYGTGGYVGYGGHRCSYGGFDLFLFVFFFQMFVFVFVFSNVYF